MGLDEADMQQPRRSQGQWVYAKRGIDKLYQLAKAKMILYIWGLSYIPLPGIGPLGRTCAALARTCARTVAQKLFFVDLGLRSFRVDCAQAFLSSVFVVHTATHRDSSR